VSLDWKNKLFFGDNLQILRKHVPDETVDLVYLDPPFNSKADYNVLFKTTGGEASAAQATAFKDTWTWDEEAAEAYHELMTAPHIPQQLRNLMEALKVFLTGDTGKRGNSMMAYLTMMALRLVELHRVLKPTGSLYLHCDPTASHYIKLIMDAVLGFGNFRNEIVWKRTHAHGSAKRFGPVHDVIFLYSKTEAYTWTDLRIPHDPDYVQNHFRSTDASGRKFQAISLTGPGVRHGESGLPWRGVDPTKVNRHWAIPGQVLVRHGLTGQTVQEKLDQLDKKGLIYWPAGGAGTPRLKWFADELEGASPADVFTDIAPISAQAQERLGYPTQKPEALLERIIQASSNEGDLVLDPFCGCGTTIAVAERLNRRWIGIDVTYLAVDLMERRLLDMFTPANDVKRLADIPVQKRRLAFKEYFKSGKDILDIGLRTGLRPFEVLGTPETVEDARFLFQNDPFQFEWWCVAMVGAQGREKKGADKGIDGIIHFVDRMAPPEYKKALVSVKGGANIKREMVATLKGDMAREGAVTGVLVTLEEPTGPMRQEAADAGRWTSDQFPDRSFPVIQLLTVEQILRGDAPDLPRWVVDTFKKAAKAKTDGPRQETMEL
jgi:DNA modification methylase